MHFSVLPESAHELVVLRPIVFEDLAPWFAYLSLPVVIEHTSWNLQTSEELLPYVWEPEKFTDSTLLRFAIARRSNNGFVGTAGFHTLSPQNRSAELAYDLSPSVWGKGVATYICGLLTSWAHSHVGLVRVQASVLESNARSVRVLERSGFEREGLLRSFRMVRGRPGNFFMYSHVVPLPPVT